MYKSDWYDSNISEKKKRNNERGNSLRVGTETHLFLFYRCLDYLANLVRFTRQFNVSHPLVVSFSSTTSSSGFFLPACGAAVVRGDGADRKKSHDGEEAKLTPDAMPETRMQPGEKNSTKAR